MRDWFNAEIVFKTRDSCAICANFNEIKNKNFYDALLKSDARGDGKQEIFLCGLMRLWNVRQSDKLQRSWLFGAFLNGS